MKRSSQYWIDSLYWLLYSLGGILIPVLITLIVLAALRYDASLGAVTGGGQFALYSAGLLTTTIYIITKSGQKRLPWAEIFGLLCTLLLSVAVAFFVIAVLSNNGADIAASIIEWPTVALFIASLIVTFFAVVADNRRIMDVRRFERMKDAEQASLNKAFDKTDKG